MMQPNLQALRDLYIHSTAAPLDLSQATIDEQLDTIGKSLLGLARTISGQARFTFVR